MKQRVLVFLLSLSLFFLSNTAVFAQARGMGEIHDNQMLEYLQLDKSVFNNSESSLAAYGILFSDPNDSGKSLVYGDSPQSGTGALAGLIDYTVYQKPLSSTEYIADVFHNFGVAQPAYAQGVGYSGLQPVLKIWKVFRNLAYFLYVIIFVVVGFMIMFRAKLNPQTVVNLQLALPRLVVTLILITFSYAIAGFMIDLIYFFIYLITGIFQIGGLIASGQNAANALMGYNIIRIGWKYLMAPNDAAGLASRSIGLIVQDVFSKLPTGGYVLGALSSVVAYFIIAVAVLINMIRTFFILLKAYISIIISVIFAPIQILLNALPGSEAFAGWLKSLAANAAVFPAAALMIMVGIVLVGDTSNLTSGNENAFQVQPGVGYGGAGVITNAGQNPGGFVPPLVLPGNVGTVDSLKALIGLGIIMLLPSVLQITHEAFSIKPSPHGAAAAGNVFVGPKVIGGAASSVLGLGYQMSIIGPQLKNILRPEKGKESIDTQSPKGATGVHGP